LGRPRPGAVYVRHGSYPKIRLKPNAAQGGYPMFETMSIPIGMIFILAGLGLAVLLGLALYKDKPGEAHHKKRGVGAQVRKTA